MLSFIDHGHRSILYTPNEVLNVPKGIEIFDSREIWEDKRITGYKKGKSVTFHPATLLSDFFRWHLQEKTDYFYKDTDYFCLRPIDRWTKEDFIERGVRENSTFARYRKNSSAVKLAVKFLSTPYPVPPWFSRKERIDLWIKKLRNRSKPIGKMNWGTACRFLENWTDVKAGERPMPAGYYFALSAKHFSQAFLPKADFEFLLNPQVRVLQMGWPVIYDWRPELLDTPLRAVG